MAGVSSPNNIYNSYSKIGNEDKFPWHQAIAIEQFKYIKQYNIESKIPIKECELVDIKSRFITPLKYSILHLTMFLG